MKQLEFAIELGTSNTCIYKRGSGIVLLEPSLVALTEEGKKTSVKAVGIQAKKMQGKTAQTTRILNPIVDGVVADAKTAFLLLNNLMKKVLPKAVVKNKIKILFVTPCGLSAKEKADYKTLGYAVGANKVEFVIDVLAGLFGSGYTMGTPSGVMSLNLGGGTVSVAAVSLNTIIAGYTISIGGNKMDEAIVRYVEEEYNLQISTQTAEKIKKEVSSLYIHDTSNIEVSGIDIESKSPRHDVVFSGVIRPAIEFCFEKITAAIEDVLNNCSPDIVSDIANNGIYVTGGLAKITGLENYLKKRLRLPITIADQPEETVIIGAGKLLSDKKSLAQMIKEN